MPDSDTTDTGQDAAAGDQDGVASSQQDGQDGAPLGDGGTKALQRERQARKDAERQLREAQSALKGYTDKDATAAERLAQLEQSTAERVSALTTRAVSAEVRALAGDFADPADAAAFLDLGKYADGDGDIDAETIKADLAELLQRKPHLKAKRGPRPDPSQGGSGGGAPDLTIGQQIAEAEKAGDLRLAIHLKNQQLADLRRAAK